MNNDWSLKQGYPQHEYSVVSDSCRYCGARWTDIEDGLTSINCDIAKQVPWSRIAFPVTLGVIITFILIWGAFHT